MHPYQKFQQELKTTLINNKISSSPVVVAISKYATIEQIKTLYNLGQRHFGERRLQDGIEKIESLKIDCPDIHWHFVGPLQSNKLKKITTYFEYIHSVGNLKHLQKINNYNLEKHKKSKVFLQVNLANETQKSGFNLEEFLSIPLEEFNTKGIVLQGLMTLPPKKNSACYFKQLRILQNKINSQIKHPMLELSMGMSNDWKSALLEGATYLRIGTLLFPKN